MKTNKAWKSITIISAILLISCVILGYYFTSKNNVNFTTELNNLIPEEIVNANISINTAFGDGTVTGEIILGGTYSGAYGHAYDDGQYINGYCVNHGASLYGTIVYGHTLDVTSSAYTKNNAKSGCSGQIKWLLDNMMRVNLTSSSVSANEITFYKQNLKRILAKQGKSAAGLDSLTNAQIFQVQQYVFWQFTNNVSNVTPAWKDYSNDARADLYNALVAEANNNSGYVGNGQNVVKITKDSNCKITQSGSDILIGPITISNGSGKMYKLSYENFTIGNHTATAGSGVKVFKSDKTTEILNNSYTTYNGTVYIKIYNYSMSQVNTTYSCSGKINALTYTTNAKYWEKAGLQSVITFDRTSASNSLNVTASYIKKVTGSYNLSINKMDSQLYFLNGAQFEAKKIDQNYPTASNNNDSSFIGDWSNIILSESNGVYKADSFEISGTNTIDVIEIKETQSPTGYQFTDKKLVLQVFKIVSESNYIIEHIRISALPKDMSFDNKTISGGNSNEYYIGTVNNSSNTFSYNDEYENLKYYISLTESGTQINVAIINPKIDLALKKTITHVTKKDETEEKAVTTENGFNVSRFNDNNENISIDTSKLKSVTTTNAIYTMNKTPVEVSIGDQVKYSIRIYNEGEVAAKAAVISDYIPDGLKVVKVEYDSAELSKTTLDEYNNSEKNTNCYIYNETTGVVKIMLNAANYIQPFNGTTLSNDSVTVYCEVEEDATGVLTNVAEIQEYELSDGTIINNDIDSTRYNWVANNNEDKETNEKNSVLWRNYSNNQQSYLDGEWHSFVAQDSGVNGNKGDDDDFDKLIVKQSYSLKIQKVNGSDNNNGIDDIKFNITRNVELDNDSINGSENFENVDTVNSQIDYSQELPANSNGVITYKLQEIENSDYVQLTEPIYVQLVIENGKMNGYKFNYGNSVDSTDVLTQTQTFTCLSENGVELTVIVEYSEENIKIIIENKVIPEKQYNIKLRKVSSGNNEPLQGVTFTVEKQSYANISTISTPEILNLQATDTNGYTEVITETINFDTYNQVDEYYIKEIDLGTNADYTKVETDIIVSVYKKLNENNEFVVDYYSVNFGNDTKIINANNLEDTITVTENGITYILGIQQSEVNNINTLTITVPNAPDNSIPLQIRKVSSEDGTTVIKGTEYTIYREGINEPLYEDIDLIGTVNLTDNIEAGDHTITYKVIEQNAADGYDNVFYNKYIKLQVEVIAGVPTSVTAKVFNSDDNAEDTTLVGNISASIVDGTIDLQIQNPETEKVIDLALKKIITEVDGIEVKAENGIESTYDRLSESDDKFRINTQPLNSGKTNAEYYLNKTPILVQKGSIIKYQIRIYNEGKEEDATASKITDYLPIGLEFVNVYYQNETTPLAEGTDYTYDSTNNVLKISVLGNKNLIAKFDGGNTLSYDYITVECKVQDNTDGILTNVAQISEYKIEDGIVDTDRDSQSDNWRNPVDGIPYNNDTIDKSKNVWINYDGYRTNIIEDGKFKNYKGQQDDDDFEKVVVGEIDLVLKKIITHINDNSVDNLDARFQRFQDGKVEVDTSIFNQNYNVTTANYYLNKTPIQVKINDKITYQIRIYNEGSFDATASEITDYIPKGLDLLSLSYNGNILTSGTDYTYNSETNILKIMAMKDNFISKYSGDRWNHVEPEYDYVTVTCQVNGAVRGLLTNVAEISKYQTFYGDTTIDRDSQTTEAGEWQEPKGSDKQTLDGKSGTSWARYYNNITIGKFMNYNGQQDDDDFEKIIVTTGYTLQLRKVSALDNSKGLENVDFKVNNNEYTTDSNGYIEKLGVFDMQATTLDMYSIEEVATNNGNYTKLKQPFYMFIAYREMDDGRVDLYGYYINFYKPRPEGDANFNDLTYNATTYHTYDENDNLVDVTITLSEDTANAGNYNFDIKIENNISYLQYDVYIKKQDEQGNSIDNAKFKVYADNCYGHGSNTVSTVDGAAYIGKFTVSEDNVNKQDTFVIQEIEVPNKYYKLNEDLQLIVTKGVKSDKSCYEISNIKLVAGDKQSETGNEVTVQGVELEKNGGTVDITAKLENNVITLIVENKEKEFDLALRKFIIEVNDNLLENSREPQIDSSKLISGESTTAKYEHSKEPVQVHVQDIVEYSIRVYNEGSRDGYAQLVMDDVPEGLLMIAPGEATENTSELNALYRWKMYRKVMNNEVTLPENRIAYGAHSYVITNNPNEAEIIVTDYLSKENGETLLANSTELENSTNPNLIKAFDSETMEEPDYKELRVEFRVKTTNQPNEIIINQAQVTEDIDENEEPVTDRDSTPNVWEESPRDDDQDIEKIVVLKEKEFDLSLRKFISEVNGVEPENSREPKVDSSKIKTGESTTAEYKHTKEALLVSPTDIVEYTLRVYNEGEVDGYATQIMDDIPEGVEMVLPTYDENRVATNLNAEYNWVMYKEVKEDEVYTLYYNGKYYAVTENVEEAVVITSDYLSKENGEAMMSESDVINPNLIKAFDIKEMDNPDYRDIKVEFKVKPGNDENKEIINYAQITDDSNSDGEEVTDRDSTPNKWESSPRDDDQDIEKIKVRYFDLALYKWVSKTIVTENGKTKEYASEHTQEDKTNLVNVTIPESELDETIVKFKYTIKVENQGQLEGYAKEIKDHIPEGIKFIAEDNKEYGWVLQEDGTITTDYLKDTLLQHGETAEVEVVLTWINGENNLGQKWNYAEISEDYNDYGAPDKDSTPNNFEGEIKEDDEDKDVVMLNVRTGSVVIIYVVLITSVLVILIAGVFGVKKYVLSK